MLFRVTSIVISCMGLRKVEIAYPFHSHSLLESSDRFSPLRLVIHLCVKVPTKGTFPCCRNEGTQPAANLACSPLKVTDRASIDVLFFATRDGISGSRALSLTLVGHSVLSRPTSMFRDNAASVVNVYCDRDEFMFVFPFFLKTCLLYHSR